MMKLLLVALFVGVASAFNVAQRASVARPSTKLYENFGLGLGEDPYENTIDPLLGEANYKQFVNRVSDNSFLNRKYNIIRRVRELDLLRATAKNGVLSALEAQGLDLETIEALLPALEEAGLLSLVANNQQLLQNGVAPLVVEGAPLLLPVVAGALKAGPSAFYLAAAVSLGLEGYLIVNDVELPLVGLPAGVFAGLLLVPLAAASAAAGSFLGSLKK